MKRRGHGEGSIYKRKDGRWAASLSLGDGRRRTFYGQRKRDVQEQLIAALNEQRQGTLATGPNQTVSRFLDRWLADTVHASVRARTHESYALNVRRVSRHIGSVRLAALTPPQVQACYRALLDGGLSPRSVEQAHAVLHCALRQATKWNLIGRNPTEAVSVPRPPRREMRTLSEEQVQRLFATTVADRFHALWVLLATTGLRVGEATGLTWVDVDLEMGILTIKRALQRQRGAGLVLVEPKTRRSNRAVHLPPGTVAALEDHRDRQEAARRAAGALWRDSGLIFTTMTGGPLDPARVNESLHRALDRAGLPRVRVHDLRHTAATLLMGWGIHPKVVQELLGHSTITLTLDTYSHVAPALHADAARHMDRLFPRSDTGAPDDAA